MVAARIGTVSIQGSHGPHPLAGDLDVRLISEKRHPQRGWVGRYAGTEIEARAEEMIAISCGTGVAALLEAVRTRMPEIPAPVALQQVAADCSCRPDLRRRKRGRRACEAGVRVRQLAIARKRGDGGKRPDSRPALPIPRNAAQRRSRRRSITAPEETPLRSLCCTSVPAARNSSLCGRCFLDGRRNAAHEPTPRRSRSGRIGSS